MKKEKKYLLLLIVLAITLISFPLLANKFSTRNNLLKQAYIGPRTASPHAPIDINNNSELDAFCVGTDGLTWSTAHVIEYYEIDGGGTVPAISIQNTDRFLIIRNITASNPGLSYPLTSAIFFNNCKNVRIIDCTVDNNFNGYNGILLWNTTDSLILDNTVSRNMFNYILISECQNITISSNTCSNNQDYGISTGGCTNCTISDNVIRNQDLVGLTIWLSSDIRALRNTCTGSGDGGVIMESANNFIKDNVFANNSFNGLNLEDGDGNIIRDNTIYKNNRGIKLDADSSNNEVFQNHLCDNTLGDILDQGTNNNIHDNDNVCYPPSAPGEIPGYPLLWIWGFISCGFAILLFKTRKVNKK